MPTSRHRLERGQGLVEYALILSLAAVVVILVLALMGNSVAVKLCDVVIQLGGTAPDSIQACHAPRVTLEGDFHNPLNVEAVVKNNHGLMKANVTVDFYIDGSKVHTEYNWRYCLGGGGDNLPACDNNYGSTLSSGQHTLRAVATDSTSNLTGEGSATFTIP